MKRFLTKKINELLDRDSTYPKTKVAVSDFCSKMNYGIDLDEKIEGIDVIMPSLNRPKQLRRTVNHLIQNAKLNIHLILVENGSDKLTVDLAKKLKSKYSDKIELLLLDKNYGGSYARQLGLKHTKYKYVAFLDNDIITYPGYFEQMMKKLIDNPQIAGIQSKVIYPNGEIQINHPDFTIEAEVIRYSDLDLGKRFDDQTTLKSYECKWTPIGATLWRREAFDKVTFDENFRTGFEDNDLSFQFTQNGYKFMNSPESLCIHYSAQFTDDLKDKKYAEGRFNFDVAKNSAKLFFKKYGLIVCYGEKDAYAKTMGFQTFVEYEEFIKN